MRFNPNPNKQAQEVISSRKIDKITIFKSFIKPHLDYGDIIYDRAYNTSFHQNIESIQYNAALPITGAVRGTSREKLYQELGFESFQQRRWYRKLCCLFKIINNQSPRYLFRLVPSPNTIYFSRNSENIPQIRTNMTFYTVDYCHKPKGIKLLTRLRLGLSHLRERNLSTAFRAASSLLHCPTYTNERLTLLNKIKSINCTILEFSDAGATKMFLFGDNTLSNSSDTILNTSYLLQDLKAPF